MIERLINLLTPTTCYVCERHNGPICYGCYEESVDLAVACCYACRARSDTYETCSRCRKQAVRPRNLWACVVFDGEVKRLVYKMKFDSSRNVARLIARKLCDTVPFVDFDVVTYLPTASSRIRKRGYDHSRLIAKTFATKRNLRFEKLINRKGQARQLGATKIGRKRQAEASYEISSKSLNYTNVLIIDDVISSGASIEAATALLRRAGVKRVYAAVFGRR